MKKSQNKDSLVKSKSQVEKIRISSQTIAKLLIELQSFIKEGITLLEIDRFAEEFIRDHKGIPAFKGFKGFPNATCISVNENVIHGIPNGYRLKPGDIVGVDVGVNTDGGFGDAAYTYAIGDISPELQKLLEVTEKALYIGINKAVKKNRVGEISHAIQSFVEPHGYTLVEEYCGHGVGNDVWEEPSVPNVGKPNKGVRLKQGMVIAIEPMVNMGKRHIYVNKQDKWTVTTKDKKPSAHFEHTVLITDGQPEILTMINNGTGE